MSDVERIRSKLALLDQRRSAGTSGRHGSSSMGRTIDRLKSGKVPGIYVASELFARYGEKRESPRASSKIDPRERTSPSDRRQNLPSFLDDFSPLGEACLYRRREFPVNGMPAYEGCRRGLAAESLTGELVTELSGASLAGAESPRVFFIDVETTGLAGGTGTVPFLVGVGEWCSERADVFVLEQFLMTDFSGEAAMMEAVHRRLEEADAIVSYNGKSFDLPILRSRAILQRLRGGWFRAPHVDLLHWARRLWRGVLPDVRLQTVESSVLGLRRGPDIDSALIPEVFFRLCRGENEPLLERVISHHAQDIVSLGLLLETVAGLVEKPETFAQSSEELVGVARWCERRREWDRATALRRVSLERFSGRGKTESLLWELSIAEKRRNAWDEAMACWEELIDSRGPWRTGAWEELAKALEHRLHDYDRCLRHLRQWLVEVEREMAWHGYVSGDESDSSEREKLRCAILHRVSRVDRKQRKLQEKSVRPKA